MRKPLYKLINKSWYLTGMLIFIVFMVLMVPVFQESVIPGVKDIQAQAGSEESKAMEKHRLELEKSIMELEKKINTYVPWSPYLVINTSGNQFYLYKYRKLYREGQCSTGSYILLESGNQQKWLFKTPRGKFRIQAKTTDPVWKKPDWAFVELGMPIPSEHHYSRYEYGVLGDYALSLGHGYLIHGTLYKMFLGLPVTHGCVRLNDEDLEAVYQTLSVGSRVYIY